MPLVFKEARHPLGNDKNMLHTVADSEYAADEIRRPTTGNVMMMSSKPIALTSILGMTVATSICDA